MDAQLETLRERFLERIAAASSAAELRAVEREALDKGGAVAGLLASIPTLPPDQRGPRGREANALKGELQRALEEAGLRLESAALEAERSGAGFDPTLPGARPERGSLHPLTQVTRELEDLFTSMGYLVLDGPEVETEHYNFEALNIPAHHPARDSQDTFFIRPAGGGFIRPAGGGSARSADARASLVLRTHTSPVQVRAMERLEPPFRAIVPGKVFRQETTDASHEHTFHQMEGLVVDRDVSVGHLIGAMKTLLRGLFGRELEVRLRPGYFPFVEPGFELDARCPFCPDPAVGCAVCKRTGWIELLPCGLVHPNVLRAGGIDPEEWSGFAFGLGLSRLAMLRFGIDDVRHLLSGDLRFLEQF